MAIHIMDAGAELFQNNPMSVICSIVCDHEQQCAGHCVLGKKGNPVHFSSIENYISDTYLDRMKLQIPEEKKKPVAVIGAGPAGLTVAIILAQHGYKVTIFEQQDKIGGITRYGIPEFRLPKSILDRLEKQILAMGIRIRPHTAIGTVLTIDDLFRDGYASVFVGTGVWKARNLGIPGECLANVHFGIDYLENPAAYDLGEKVAIIGMGNAAMDVARTALRNGALQVEADSTIIAISQGPRNRLIRTTVGLEGSDKGLLIVDENEMTTREGVFAAGDVVRGSKTVVHAVEQAKKAAVAMIAYMEKES